MTKPQTHLGLWVAASALLLIGCFGSKPPVQAPQQAMAPVVTAPPDMPEPDPTEVPLVPPLPPLPSTVQTATTAPPATHPQTPKRRKRSSKPSSSSTEQAAAQTPEKPERKEEKPVEKSSTQQASAPTGPPAASPPSNQQASTSGGTVASLGDLTEGDVSGTSQLESQTRNLIQSIENGLKGLPRPLSESDHETETQINAFLKQARQSLSIRDAVGAHTLATKAKLLLDELTKK